MTKVVSTDHGSIKYLIDKKVAKTRPTRLILLLQEFNFENNDK